MNYSRTLAAGLLASGVMFGASAMAACTDAQAEAKMTELTNLMGPLMGTNPTLTQTLATEMQALLMAPTTDATCTGYDKLIVRARTGR